MVNVNYRLKNKEKCERKGVIVKCKSALKECYEVKNEYVREKTKTLKVINFVISRKKRIFFRKYLANSLFCKRIESDKKRGQPTRELVF